MPILDVPRFNLKTHSFLVQIDDMEIVSLLGFREVRGLALEGETFDLAKTGSSDRHEYVRNIRPRRVTLARGLDLFGNLFEWIEAVRDWRPGKLNFYRTVSIFNLKECHGVAVAVRGWELRNCKPVEYKAPDDNAMSDEVAIEQLTLSYDALHAIPLRESALIAAIRGAGARVVADLIT